MKNIALISGLIALALLASCTKEEEKIAADATVNSVISDTQEVISINPEEDEQSAEDVNEIPEEVMKDEDSETMMKTDGEISMGKGDEDEVMMEDSSEQGEIMKNTELAGVYTDYETSLVGVSDSTVLFFNAPWCPSCVAADKSISADVVPEGLSVLKVDFDTSTDLRKKYGVTGQHTFVQIDEDGEMIKKWVGGNSLADIVERIQ